MYERGITEMIIKAIKFIGVITIIAGFIWAVAEIEGAEPGTPFFEMFARMMRGFALAGAGGIARFCAAWYEYEQKQKNKNGRRSRK